MKLRIASVADAKCIANLHADSWRRHYRGAYSDRFLDGEIVAERLSFWSKRLDQPGQGQFTVVAEDQDGLAGFAHTIPEHDAVYGTLLDNLHVRFDRKRSGIGGELMRQIAENLKERTKLTCLYLWVLEQNRDAQAFYTAKGGACVGREVRGPFPGGGAVPALRYYWPDLAASFHARDRENRGQVTL